MASKPKPVRRKAPERKTLVAKLDKITSEIVRRRDGECVLCGKRTGLQCGHVISRMKYAVRWDLTNTNTQCDGCNLHHNYQPHKYINWFIGKWGLKEWEALCRRAEKPAMKTVELHALLERMQDLKERLESLSVYDHDYLVEIGAWG